MAEFKEAGVWLQCPACGYQYEAGGTPGNPAAGAQCPSCGYRAESEAPVQPVGQAGIPAPTTMAKAGGNRTIVIAIAIAAVAVVAAFALGAYMGLSNQDAVDPAPTPDPASSSAQASTTAPSSSAAPSSASSAPAVANSFGSLDGDVFTCKQFGLKVVPNRNVELDNYDFDDEGAYAFYTIDDAVGNYIGHAGVYVMGDAQFDTLDWFLDSGASALPARIAGLEFWYEVEARDSDDGLGTHESYEYVRVDSDVIILIDVYGKAGSSANELFLSAFSAI